MTLNLSMINTSVMFLITICYMICSVIYVGWPGKIIPERDLHHNHKSSYNIMVTHKSEKGETAFRNSISTPQLIRIMYISRHVVIQKLDQRLTFTVCKKHI